MLRRTTPAAGCPPIVAFDSSGLAIGAWERRVKGLHDKRPNRREAVPVLTEHLGAAYCSRTTPAAALVLSSVALLHHRARRGRWSSTKARKALRGRAVQRWAEAPDVTALVLRSRLEELAKRVGPGDQRWEELAGAKVLLPASTIPWGLVHFVGGAVLGQFPELCYNSLLRPLADRAGVAVICTPYETGREHDALARKVGDTFEDAVAAGAARYGWAVARMPRIALGHSLGAKLQVLLRCDATTTGSAPLYGCGLLAFNNYGVEDQVKLLREVLESLQGGSRKSESTVGNIWETVMPAIGRAAKLSGLEFRPSPEELLDSVSQDWNGPSRFRIFSFEGDTLDCAQDLLDALAARGVPNVERLVLQGGHLTPVLLSFADVFGATARKDGLGGQMASRVTERLNDMGGVASLGDEAELETLVEELVAWVGGRS